MFFFKYEHKLTNGIPLTNPWLPVSNLGNDNSAGHLIVRVGELIGPSLQKAGRPYEKKYVVESLLGSGAYGQVFRCMNVNTHDHFAIKVVKNKPSYDKQATIESDFLNTLRSHDPRNEYHVLHLEESFTYYNHRCLVTEVLGDDLHTVIKENGYNGLSLTLVSSIVRQILECCTLLASVNVIHTDLKPENILVDKCLPSIKVIDFGCATQRKDEHMYMQTRYYRAPELLSGRSYDSAIDVWSVGCIAAELFLGRPLFPGQSEHDQIARIIAMLGSFPSDMVLRGSTLQRHYAPDSQMPHSYRLMTMEENTVAAKKNGRVDVSLSMEVPKQYEYIYPTIEETIDKHAAKILKTPGEAQPVRSFAHFLGCLLRLDPKDRLTPSQALCHPFICQAPFSCSWKPPAIINLPLPFPHPLPNYERVDSNNSFTTQITGGTHFPNLHSFPNLFNSGSSGFSNPFNAGSSGSSGFSNPFNTGSSGGSGFSNPFNTGSSGGSGFSNPFNSGGGGGSGFSNPLKCGSGGGSGFSNPFNSQSSGGSGFSNPFNSGGGGGSGFSNPFNCRSGGGSGFSNLFNSQSSGGSGFSNPFNSQSSGSSGFSNPFNSGGGGGSGFSNPFNSGSDGGSGLSNAFNSQSSGDSGFSNLFNSQSSGGSDFSNPFNSQSSGSSGFSNLFNSQSSSGSGFSNSFNSQSSGGSGFSNLLNCRSGGGGCGLGNAFSCQSAVSVQQTNSFIPHDPRTCLFCCPFAIGASGGASHANPPLQFNSVLSLSATTGRVFHHNNRLNPFGHQNVALSTLPTRSFPAHSPHSCPFCS